MTTLYLEWRDSQLAKAALDGLADRLIRDDRRAHEHALGRFARLIVGAL